MSGHLEITPQQKTNKIKRIMKRTGFGKAEASRFLKLLLTNERFKGYKGKVWAFKMASKKGLSIDDAMKLITKRRKKREENNAMDNLTGGDGDASSTIETLETQSLENEYDDFDGKEFVTKNKMYIIVGIGAFLLFTKMGKGLIKKITG